MLPEPLTLNRGSGLHRPINVEHLPYRGRKRTCWRTSQAFGTVLIRKAVSCFLTVAVTAPDWSPPLKPNQSILSTFVFFPSFSGETDASLFFLEPRRGFFFFLPNLTEGLEVNRGPTQYHLLERSREVAEKDNQPEPRCLQHKVKRL